MSEIATLITHGLTVVGQGLATASDLSGVRPRQKASLYADPLSWLVFEAVERAVADYGEELLSEREDVGHIVISDHCTTHTMGSIGAEIPRGRISPLRFSGANPGSICSLPSQFLGFSGPSMTLSMPPEKGSPTAVTIARSWLRQRSVAHVFVTTHSTRASHHRVTSTILMQTQAGD